MTASCPRSLKNRRRITVAGLLALVALFAFGLGGYRQAEPWIAMRRAHPTMAPVSALLTRSPESFRCTACHAMAKRSPTIALVAPATPPHAASRTDCKSCHGR